MSAETVWARVVAYRTDSAKQIQRKYEYKLSNIIDVLETYVHKDEYHGHESGSKGEAENDGTAKMLDAAIAWLNLKVPVPTATLQKRGFDPVKRGNNLALEDELMKLIPEPDVKAKLFGVTQALDARDVTWRTKRNVKQKYNLVAKLVNKTGYPQV